MFANRISYTFDFQGPSYTVDTACSSSLLAMALAVASLRKNECDAAIVAGAHITLLPTTALQFLRLGLLSSYGACKSFADEADGYCRSEGIVAVLLQKASIARRIYATVVHAKTNTDGYKANGITFPSGQRQLDLLNETYKEADIDPSLVAYVEAHGTGTIAGDAEEGAAIAEFFCKNRNTSLLVGSVKSNMGHAEPASGLASLVKVLLAMETGILPPNLHFNVPNNEIAALKNNIFQVVTKPTKWNGGIVGINSFGFGGSNVHLILKY